MITRDTQLLQEAYAQIQNEGLVKDTLLAAAFAGLSLLAAKGTAKTMHDYNAGYPSLRVPATDSGEKVLTNYLKQLAGSKVELDPKHLKYLKTIADNSNALTKEQQGYLETIKKKQYNLQWSETHRKDGKGSLYKPSPLFEK